jgi:dienelactone hydrolase
MEIFCSIRRGLKMMYEACTHGLRVVGRCCLLPATLGLRLWDSAHPPELPHVPKARWGPKLAAKLSLDELFFSMEFLVAGLDNRPDKQKVAREVEQALELYHERGWLEHPESYYPKPPALTCPLIETKQAWGMKYEVLKFASEYEPFAGEPGRNRWLDYLENRAGHAWVLRDKKVQRPWVICIPGFRMGTPWVDAQAFHAPFLLKKLGWNVIIPVLPLHGPRTVGIRSGDNYLHGDYLDTVHAHAQAIWDIRRLISWIIAQGAPAIVSMGISLGGYTTAMLASVAEELSGAIAGIPPSDFLALIQENTPRLLGKIGSSALPLHNEQVTKLLKVVSPLSMQPKVPKSKLFMFAGNSDRLVHPSHPYRLWKHWQEPEIYWYDGGHGYFLFDKGVQALVKHGLENCYQSS